MYQPNETVRLDVRLENETVWLTQLKIAELFGVQKAAISKHVRNIFASGELVRDATVSKMETVQDEGGRMVVRSQEFFNLDVIIAVGYRVNSHRATQFRIWATKVLKDYLLRGYAVNQRLNQLEDRMDRRLAKHDDDIAELKDKVDFFVQTKEPPLQGIFYQGRYWDAKSLLIKFIRRSRRHRREDGHRNHLRTSRLHPQGDNGTPRIQQRQTAKIACMKSGCKVEMV